MKGFSHFLLFFLAVLFVSCLADNFETNDNTGKLEFSSDTVYLDTIFSNISTSTRTLKVYNRSNKNLTIPSIYLGKGENSFYRMNVDGVSGKSIQNIDILAKDSLFIFLEATIDFNQVINPLYTDSIIFTSTEEPQSVQLVTLVQDAHFLYPKRDSEGVKETIVLGQNGERETIAVEGFYLKDDETWDDQKPYVIYGFVGVPEGRTLTLKEGTKVFFHKNSGLLVDKGGSLKMLGERNAKIVLEGDRLEQDFNSVPGQWSTVWLRSGSRNNEFSNVVIKNNEIGIVIDSISDVGQPTLALENVEIYNTGSFGILGRGAHISGENIVIGNNGSSSLACTFGGSYAFKHCTFANFWTKSVRQFPTVLVNNFLNFGAGNGAIVARPLSAEFLNCIIDGGQNIEFILDKNEEATFDYFFKNNLLKFNDFNGSYANNPLYDFEDPQNYQNNILNGNVDFQNVFLNQYNIEENSDAINTADLQTAQKVPQDIVGVSRFPDPDIGAYEFKVEE